MRKFLLVIAICLILCTMFVACDANPDENIETENDVAQASDPLSDDVSSNEPQEYSIEVSANMPNALVISGETSQVISLENPDMAAITVTANFGYVFSHYTVNGQRFEASETIKLDSVTEDAEIMLCADYATYELPIININTHGADITSKEEYVEETEFSIINCGEYDDLVGITGGIRLRGNSTMSYPKKPYRIKFDKKQSLFGLDKAKSWVLLAEYLDPSALHNYTAFTLANEMPGMGFNPTPIKVNVYLNGRFDGIYTLCEQIQENEGRIGNEIDITEDMVDLKDFNFFIAMDLSCRDDAGAKEDLTYIKIPIPDYEGNELEEEFMIIEMKYPEPSQFASEEQFISYREQLREYMIDLLDALATGDADYIKQEVNVNSLIDYLIVDQIMDEDDHHFKSFNMYFTNTSDNEAENGKLSFGPVWDYDYSLGVPWQGVPNLHFNVSHRMYFSNIFFRGMMNIPEFEEFAKTRYREYMRPALLEFLENYDVLVASMETSVALNQERWYADPDQIGGQMNERYYRKFVEVGDELSIKNIDFLKRSLEDRIILLDRVWKK